MRVGAAMAVFFSLLASASGARAEPLVSLPFGDEPARADLERKVVWAAAVALRDESIPRFDASLVSARRVGQRRALERIHRFVDDALARAYCLPWHASVVHAAVDRDAEVTGVRPLLDGGAVVVVEVPLSALESAAPTRGISWS